jgi:alpha-galactosidase
MLAAPLMTGNDLRSMTSTTRDILTKKDVIDVNQDPLGIQGFKYSTWDSVETWVRPLQNDEWAVTFLNRSVKPKQIQFNWTSEVISDTLFHRELNTSTTEYRIYDLWQNKDLGKTKRPLKSTVPGHDVLMLRLRK